MPKTFWSQDLRYTYRNRQYWVNVTTPSNVTTVTANSISDPAVTRSQYGYKDTDWKTKVKKKQNASSEYVYDKLVIYKPLLQFATATGEIWNSSQHYYDVRNMDLMYSELATNLLGARTTSTSLADLALKRFKQKASSAIGSERLVVPVIELRELRSTILKTCSSATGFIKSLASLISRGKRKRWSSKLLDDSIKDLWLSWSFGIAPTISDTMNAVEALNSYLERNDKVHAIRAGARETWMTSNKQYSGDSFRFTRVTTGHAFHTLTYVYVGGIRLRVNSANNYSLSEHLGFSDLWSEVPSIAWELMPFSWVFDYFSTMGDYLEDTFTTTTYSMVWLDLCRHYKGSQTHHAELIHGHFGAETTVLSLLSRCRDGQTVNVSGSRKPQATLPTRQLRFKSADEIGKNAVNKLLNLASILRRK